MDKAHLQAREDYFELHDRHSHFSYSTKLMPHMSTDIYTDCPETQSLKLKADLDAGVSFIFAGMEESTELFYFQMTDFEPLQCYFTTSKEQWVSPLLAYLVSYKDVKLGHTACILICELKDALPLSVIGWSITKFITQILWKNSMERTTSMWTQSTCITLHSGFQSNDEWHTTTGLLTSSMYSSKNRWGCRREEASSILGNQISWLMEPLVWMLGSRRRLQRTGVPFGVIEKIGSRAALRKRETLD